MKLFFSPTSPYVRKVRVTAIEKGLGGRITLVPCNAHDPGPDLLAANPLARIPTLVPDGGQPLFDSPVICEWLDAVGEGPALIPANLEERWTVLRGQALADGVLDDAVAMVMERRRTTGDPSPETEAVRLAAIRRALAWLEARPELVAGPLTLAHIAIGCALGYLDFRLPELAWRSGHGGLAGWYQGFAQRPAMLATVPQSPPA
jgi:glutathione S-transferase